MNSELIPPGGALSGAAAFIVDGKIVIFISPKYKKRFFWICFKETTGDFLFQYGKIYGNTLLIPACCRIA
jgi:hypothetical protein